MTPRARSPPQLRRRRRTEAALGAVAAAVGRQHEPGWGRWCVRASSSPLCLIPLLVLFHTLDLDLVLTLGLALALPGAQQCLPGAPCGRSLPAGPCPRHSMQRATGDFRKMPQQSPSSSASGQPCAATAAAGACQLPEKDPGRPHPRRLRVESHSSQSLEKRVFPRQVAE